MAKLLSGATLRAGGSNTYITLSNAQPQLPPSPSTSTGFTVVTNSLLVTSYASSLGNIQFTSGTMWSNVPDQNIVLVGTDSSYVMVTGGIEGTGTTTGAFVVEGDVGVQGTIFTGKDIHVNGLTIGKGYENDVGGVNNISITAPAETQLNDFNVGQQNIRIGHGALVGIDTAYKTVAIGREAASTGTELRNIIAIGDRALKNIGTKKVEFAGTITTATQAVPVVITVPGHNISEGTEITIYDVEGMTELNGNKYYVDVLSTSTLALFTDNILGAPLDGRGFNAFTGTGNVDIDYVWNNNFAIGTDAGTSLINGQDNFFLGYNIAPNFTTGSYNFFLGHEIALAMTHGNANISIGGDNLIDGLDNQVNIGSVFYYNGNGYLELNADTAVGYGTTATSTRYGALQVLGGVAITDNMKIGGPVNVINYVESTSTATGSLTVNGGLGIAGDVYAGKNVKVIGQLNLTATTQSTSTVTGALVVRGGVGIGGDLWVGGVLHASISGGAGSSNSIVGGTAGALVYQTQPNVTGFISIGSTGSVLVSDGSNPVWSNTLTSELAVTSVDTLDTATYYVALVNTTTGASLIDASANISYNNSLQTFAVNSTTTATSTDTGALVVVGGVGVQGSIYSANGNPLQNNLLYTPQVRITDTGIPPTTPNVGDFWVDSLALGYFQFIQDGTSTFWIQVTTL